MYQRKKSGWLKHLDFLIADAIMFELAFVIAYMLRHGMQNPWENQNYAQMSFVLLFLDLLVAFLFQSYKDVLRRGFYIEMKKVFFHVSVVVMLALVYLFFMHSSVEFSRIVFGITWVFGILFLYVERIIMKAFIRHKMVYHTEKRSMLLVTTTEDAEEIIQNFKLECYRDYKIDGIVLVNDENELILDVAGVPVIGNATTSIDYMQHHVVDEIFIHVNKQYELPTELIHASEEMGITTHLVMLQAKEMAGEQMIEQFANYTVLTSSFSMANPGELLFKRILDIIGGVVGMILTGILFLFVAPVIKIQSPGPVFFGQERVGLNGRRFKLYKFRSMYVDAEERKKELMAQNEMDGFMFKMKNDPRIFPFGNFMRKSSIDEFPQFWNVFKGDMSLVGTRPPTVDEYKHYDSHHKKRLTMKPGITGLWQVSGRSQITDFEEVVKLDTKYISGWNIGKDIKILGKTVVTVVRRKGSV